MDFGRRKNERAWRTGNKLQVELPELVLKVVLDLELPELVLEQVLQVELSELVLGLDLPEQALGLGYSQRTCRKQSSGFSTTSKL